MLAQLESVAKGKILQNGQKIAKKIPFTNCTMTNSFTNIFNKAATVHIYMLHKDKLVMNMSSHVHVLKYRSSRLSSTGITAL